jgi:hypothetical protein
MKQFKTIVAAAALAGAILLAAPVTRGDTTDTQQQIKTEKSKKEALELAATLENAATDDATRINTCAQLASMGSKASPAVPALESALSSPNSTVRADAAIALMKIGPGAAAAKPMLHTLQNQDPDPNVRKAATAAIVSIETKPSLLKSIVGAVTGKPTSLTDAKTTPPLSTFQQETSAAAGALGYGTLATAESINPNAATATPAAYTNSAQPGLAALPNSTAQQIAPHQLLLHTVDVADSQLRTTQAVSLLLPEQWTGNAGINWTPADLSSPAEPKFELTQPQTDEMVRAQPLIYCYWSTDPNFVRTAKPGSTHRGAIVMTPPANWQDALAKIAWPRVVSAQTNSTQASLLSFRDMPASAQAYASALPQMSDGCKYQASAGCMRVRYNESSNSTVDADLMGVYCIITNPATGESNWMIDHLIEFKAPTGQLDAMEKQADFITGSVRPHSQWFADYLQMQQYLIARNTTADPNSVPQIRPGSAGPLDAQQLQSMQRYQTGFDQSLLAMDRGIGGAQYFQLADGSYLPFPSGYGYAWTDGVGNFLVSSTPAPAFPQSTAGPTSWQPLRPIQFKQL